MSDSTYSEDWDADRDLLEMLPTEMLRRVYRRRVAAERRYSEDTRLEVIEYDVDKYDELSDATCRAAAVLRDRGIEICEYCAEIEPDEHTSPTCPWGAWIRREVSLWTAIERHGVLRARLEVVR